MAQNILTVRSSKHHTTDQMHELGREISNAQFINRLLAGLFNLFVNFGLAFFVSFFNSGWMDASVSQKFFQSKFGNVAANRVKTANYNSIRTIIYQNFHA